MAGPDSPPWLLPMIGGACLDINGHAHQGVDHGEAIGTGIDAAAGIVADVGLVGRQLGDQRLAGDCAAGCDHACRHVRIIAEGDPAFLDIRAGDIDLDGVDGGIIKAARDFGIFLYSGSGDIGNKTGFAEIQRRQDLPDDMVCTGILQTDSIEHAGRCFSDPVWPVAESGLQRSTLQADGTDIPVGKAGNPCIFFAKADAA